MKSQKSLNNIASADLKRSFASNLVIPALTFLAFTVQAAVCTYFQFKQKEKVFFTWFQELARLACFHLILRCSRRRDTGGIYPAVHQHKESVKCVVQLQSQPLDAL